MPHPPILKLLLFVGLLSIVSGLSRTLAAEEPAAKPEAAHMLAGDWVPKNPHQIDFKALPRIPTEHAVVSDVRPRKGVNQHNYLIHHDGRYWAMWSDGPGVEDQVGQRVSYSTSRDGSQWTKPQFMTPVPPDSAPDSPHYGTRTDKGWRWISRGFWKRDGELLALASLDEAAGFFGKGLRLRAFRWNEADDAWEDAGLVHDNAINNFPPQKLSTGQWMMSRRPYDYGRRGVEFLTGGVEALDQWTSVPVLGSSEELAAEEPCWWTLPDGRLAAMFRDNRRSGFIYRSLSEDNGKTWSRPFQTNFPDARSKFHGFRLQDGRYILVSNPNPQRRDPLSLAISDDGLVFTKMGYLAGGRHVDYPHTMEHDGQLFIAFATGKQTVEVLRVRLEDLDSLQMPSEPLTAAPPYHPTPEDIVVDHRDRDQVEIVGEWGSSSASPDRHGEDYLFLEPGDQGSVRFTPKLTEPGRYEIYAIWNNRGSRSSSVSYHIEHAEGNDAVIVDQNEPGGTWRSLGTFPLSKEQASVRIEAKGQGEYIVADAILFAPRPE